MLFGLSIGLAVALFVYLRSGTPRMPPMPETAAVETESAKSTPPPPEPPAAQEETAEPESDETRLGFYELLEKLEVAVPEGSRAAGASPQLAGEYTIQAGAFKTPEEADSRRARLALLAIDSHVERAIVNNDVWHRVIIGPLGDIDEIDRILRRLKDEHIDTMPPKQVDD